MVGDETFGEWLLGRPLRVGLIVLSGVVVTIVFRALVRRFSTRRLAQGTRVALDSVTRSAGGKARSLESDRLHSRADTMRSVVANTGTTVIWVLTSLLVLGELDIDIGPLIAGAGIAGVALGFGAQQMVRDYLAGFFILSEDQFGIGDVVDLGEAVGTVEDVSLRSTRLRDIDGVVWHVPNGVLTRVGNKSKQWARARVDVSVAYDSDLREAMAVILSTAEALAGEDDWRDRVLETPEMWGVEELAADGVTLRLIVKTRPGDQFEVTRELHVRLKEALDAAGIEIPFPQRTMWVKNAAEPGPAPF
jgi:small-conductance mechanosensitive channel